jgi:hypothetical protein
MQEWAFQHKTKLLFAAILLLGIFARTWEFRSLPPGLHHDEASIGVDAYYLYRYGVDRHNISYPVHFISWGSGQNAPYAYLLIPFIALFGLSPVVIRLPILLSGIATLPFIFWIFRRVVDEKFGLFAMFCIAISPWHILLSRWGLESNLLPLFFSIGFLFLLKSKENWRWFLLANLVFALCLYTYGITYAFLPIFLLLAVIVLYQSRILNLRQIALGLTVLFIAGLPIILFVAINIFGLDSIHLGPVTIPHLPIISRFEEEGVMFKSNWISTFGWHSLGMLNLLLSQNDNRIRNVFPPYGYFYGYTFPLAIAGAIWLARTLSPKREEKLLWFSWLIAAVILGALEPVIVNRVNVIFIPLIGLIAYFIYRLGTYSRFVLPVASVILLIAFAFFTTSYHGEQYRLEAGKEFYTGFLPALELAQKETDLPICISNYKVIMPYIFVLYTEKVPPAELVQQIHYSNPTTPFREADRLGRYTFGLDHCGENLNSAYILFRTEKLDGAKNYRKIRSDYFILYLPKK